MGAPDVTDDLTANDGRWVTVPADIRDRPDIDPGDELRWPVTGDAVLRVEVLGGFRGENPGGHAGCPVRPAVNDDENQPRRPRIAQAGIEGSSWHSSGTDRIAVTETRTDRTRRELPRSSWRAGRPAVRG